jgi:hypothetical protein
MPIFAAAMSINRSMTKVEIGRPTPRYGPVGAFDVATACTRPR